MGREVSVVLANVEVLHESQSGFDSNPYDKALLGISFPMDSLLPNEVESTIAGWCGRSFARPKRATNHVDK